MADELNENELDSVNGGFGIPVGPEPDILVPKPINEPDMLPRWKKLTDDQNIIVVSQQFPSSLKQINEPDMFSPCIDQQKKKP